MSARSKRVISTEEIQFNHKPAKMLLTAKKKGVSQNGQTPSITWICSYYVLYRPVFERCQTLLHPELTLWWSFLLADGAHHKKPHSPTHPMAVLENIKSHTLVTIWRNSTCAYIVCMDMHTMHIGPFATTMKIPLCMCWAAWAMHCGIEEAKPNRTMCLSGPVSHSINEPPMLPCFARAIDLIAQPKITLILSFSWGFSSKWHFVHTKISFAHPEWPFLAKSMRLPITTN